MNDARPIEPSERIFAMDAIRGQVRPCTREDDSHSDPELRA